MQRGSIREAERKVRIKSTHRDLKLKPVHRRLRKCTTPFEACRDH